MPCGPASRAGRSTGGSADDGLAGRRGGRGLADLRRRCRVGVGRHATEYERRRSTLSDARSRRVRSRAVRSLLTSSRSGDLLRPGDTAIRTRRRSRHPLRRPRGRPAGAPAPPEPHVDADAQRSEIVDGPAALREHLGVEPQGYARQALGADAGHLRAAAGVRVRLRLELHGRRSPLPRAPRCAQASVPCRARRCVPRLASEHVRHLTPPSQVKETWLAEIVWRHRAPARDAVHPR